MERLEYHAILLKPQENESDRFLKTRTTPTFMSIWVGPKRVHRDSQDQNDVATRHSGVARIIVWCAPTKAKEMVEKSTILDPPSIIEKERGSRE